MLRREQWVLGVWVVWILVVGWGLFALPYLVARSKVRLRMGPSANSLWQGRRRRALSVKGSLPKWDFFSATLAGRCHSTHFCGTVAAKLNLMS